MIAAAQPASASIPPTSPPGTEIGTPIPVDFVALVDDTGTISVEVPASWNDVDTVPDGDIPSIVASPDLDRFRTSFDNAGMTYRADRYREDTLAAARAFGPMASCDREVAEPYDDGVFAGSHLTYTDCAGSDDVEVHVIAANPADQTFTALLFIQIIRPDELPVVNGILATFNVASGPQPGPASVPAGSIVPPTAEPAGSYPPPTGEIPGDWTMLVDDTDTIALAVPSTWTATNVAPGENADGTPRPWISATTDPETFFPPAGSADTFSVPGVVYQAAPFVADTAAELQASVYNEQCIPGPVEKYDDGVFVGHIQTFDACGGTASRIVQVAANPADEAFTALVLVQLTGQPDDHDTLNGLLLSFSRVDPGATADTTSATEVPTPSSDPLSFHGPE
jgi:hypothetical protein